MPANVYKLVFTDTDLKKLAPSPLEIDSYTTDTVKSVGSCVFYLVHLNTKKLHEVTFLLLHQMEVHCYHVLQHLCLDWYTQEQDYIICNQELAWLPVQVTTQRRPSLECLFIVQERSVHSKLKTRIYSVESSASSSEIGDKYRANFTKTPRGMWWDWMLPRSPHIIFNWIQMLHQNTPLVDWFQFTWKKLSSKKSIRCWKWEFWNQFMSYLMDK